MILSICKKCLTTTWQGIFLYNDRVSRKIISKLKCKECGNEELH